MCNHCCAFQGGRGNNVQFLAIINDVLFPCEMVAVIFDNFFPAIQ